MEYNKAITDLAIGDAIEGFYLLRSAQSKITSTGKPFLILTLADRTGAVEGKVWDYAGPIGRADEGKVVKIRGNVGEYRGSVQITVDRIRLAAEGDPVDPASLVPEAPIEKDAAMAEVRRYLASIQDADYRAAAEELLRRHERDFPLIPAAKSVHHGFRMGLLMHTGNMLKIADFLAGLYPEVIDRSLLLAGTFAHDLAKAREFQLSELGLATDYTAAGQLLGHLVMGAQEAAEVTKALGIPEEKGMLLQQYQAKAVIALIGADCARSSDDIYRVPASCALSWGEVALMSRSGLVEFASHTYDLHRIRNGRKGADRKKGEDFETYARLLREDSQKNQILITAAAGKPPQVFAWPYGAYPMDGAADSTLKALGMQATFTSYQRTSVVRRGDADSLYGLGRYLRTPRFDITKITENASG